MSGTEFKLKESLYNWGIKYRYVYEDVMQSLLVFFTNNDIAEITISSFSTTTFDKDIMPYIHVFVYHAHYFVQWYGTLKPFEMEAVEQLNYVNKLVFLELQIKEKKIIQSPNRYIFYFIKVLHVNLKCILNHYCSSLNSDHEALYMRSRCCRWKFEEDKKTLLQQ